MIKKFILLILFVFGCSNKVYLNTEGTIVEIHEKHVRIVFSCDNVKRPDCFGASNFSKEQFPFAYIGQKVIITKK